MRQIPPPILVSDPTQASINNQIHPQLTVSQSPKKPSPFLTVDSTQFPQTVPSVTTYSNNIKTTIQNATTNSNQTIRSPIVRVIKSHPIPGRPLSTFPFSSLSNKKQSAAPYPALPSKLEITEQKNKVEQEIQCLRAELSSLIHQRNFYNDEIIAFSENQSKKSENEENDDDSTNKPKPKCSTVLPTDITKTSIGSGVKEYHNILIIDPLIESVINSNRSKKKESESNEGSLLKDSNNNFKRINDLPLYKTTIQDIKEIVTPVFYMHFKSRDLINEKQKNLAKNYVERFESCKLLHEKVDDYNLRVDSVNENWPSDFPKGKTKTESIDELLKWTAPDQPMLMTKTRLTTNCYYNTNGLVEDPVAAHDQFKNRISWSDEEKKKFVSKYMQHPKKFRLIADSLPLKSVKDVIEFYYVNRYALSLKEKETARRKRGGKKKVVSEGSAKTTK